MGVAGAFQDRAERRRVMRRVAALECGGVARAQADVLGRHLEGANFAVPQFDDPRRRRRRHLVEPVAAMDDPDALGAEIAQHLRHRLEPAGREHADQLTLHAGGIRQRPEQVEDRARAELDPRRADMTHRGVMGRRHHEADAGLAHAALDRLGRNADLDAERRQHVRRARFRRRRAVAVLGDRHAAGRDDQRGERRDIVGAGAVAAGAHDVDGAVGRRDAQHLGAHRGNRAGDFLDGFAANAQAPSGTRRSAPA